MSALQKLNWKQNIALPKHPARMVRVRGFLYAQFCCDACAEDFCCDAFDYEFAETWKLETGMVEVCLGWEN